MSRQFTKEFKEDTVRYYLEHKDLGLSSLQKPLSKTICTF